MNLAKLFETQKVLRDRINYNEPDRPEKLALALLVELGERANEWRGFKFWSKDQEPRITKKVKCPSCNGAGMIGIGKGVRGVKVCPDCKNPRGGTIIVNSLLEEYVDGLHFVLELGIEERVFPIPVSLSKETSVTDSFLSTMEAAVNFDIEPSLRSYGVLFGRFCELGRNLGFTDDQIEEAYFEKNKINHQRQSEGY